MEKSYKEEFTEGWDDGLSYGMKNYKIIEDKGYKYGIEREIPASIYEKTEGYKNGFFEGLHSANGRLNKEHKILSVEEILNHCGKQSIVIGGSTMSRIGTGINYLFQEGLNQLTNKQNWLNINKNNIMKLVTNIFSRKK